MKKVGKQSSKTARKGHLANHQLAKLYSTTLCPMVPKNVSLLYIETLNALQQKKAEQKAINATMENRLNFEKEKLITSVNYLINAELHQCIKAARDIPNKPYNFEVELVSAEED